MKNLVKTLKHQIAMSIARSHSSFTFILNSDWSTTKQKVCVTEIVWWLVFADVTFRMERTDDRKYVCVRRLLLSDRKNCLNAELHAIRK